MPLENILNIQGNTSVSVIQEKTAIVEQLGEVSETNQAPWITKAKRIELTQELATTTDELLSKVTPLTLPKE